MSLLTVYLRALPRAHSTLLRAPTRAFHSPFVVLSASTHLASPSTPASMYEKQDDTSPEPHLSSSGTRTYVVSEPDPSNTPYEVPSGAYPTSSPYVDYGPTAAPNPKGLYSSTNSSLPHAYTMHEGGARENVAAGNVEVPGEASRREGSTRKISLMDATSASGKF